MSKSEAGKLGQIKARITMEKQKKERRKAYDKNPARCKHCSGPLKWAQKKNSYCSHSCAATVTNLQFGRRVWIRLERNCASCGKKTSNPKFCSNQCGQDFNFNTYVDRWKRGEVSGIVSENTTPMLSKFIRTYLFKKYNNCCSKCGWAAMNPTTKKIPLEVEHIDGNSENNREENLTLLCPNCHSLTATFRGANKGNGRHYRRERYRSGKSY